MDYHLFSVQIGIGNKKKNIRFGQAQMNIKTSEIEVGIQCHTHSKKTEQEEEM